MSFLAIKTVDIGHDTVTMRIAVGATDGSATSREFEVTLRFDPDQAEEIARAINIYDPEIWARDTVLPADAMWLFKGGLPL